MNFKYSTNLSTGSPAVVRVEQIIVLAVSHRDLGLITARFELGAPSLSADW